MEGVKRFRLRVVDVFPDHPDIRRGEDRLQRVGVNERAALERAVQSALLGAGLDREGRFGTDHPGVDVADILGQAALATGLGHVEDAITQQDPRGVGDPLSGYLDADAVLLTRTKSGKVKMRPRTACRRGFDRGSFGVCHTRIMPEDPGAVN